MSEKNNSKRKKASLETDEARGQAKSLRFHPGPEFKEVHQFGQAGIDFDGVGDGSKEIWLIQIPKSSLHGTSMVINASDTASDEKMGTIKKDGVRYRVVKESNAVSQQLFMVACEASATGSSRDLGMIPFSKRVTLKRVEEGLLPLPLETEEQEEEKIETLSPIKDMAPKTERKKDKKKSDKDSSGKRRKSTSDA